MLKWFIIGTLLYYAIFLWRYRDSLGTWFRGRKKQPEQPESKPTVKTGNGDSLVGASRYRMGQMRTNGDILGHLSKGVDNASIFVPQSDEAEEETPASQAIETEFEMEFEKEETDVRRTKSKRKKSPVTWGTVSRKWHRVSRWGNWCNGTSHSGGTSDRKRGTASRSDHLPDGNKPVSFTGGTD